MGVHVSWIDDSHTAILVDFVGHWTWDELRAANDQQAAMMKSVTHVVDTVNDLTSSGGVPSGALSEARAMMSGFDTGEGLVIAVNAGGFVESLFGVFQRIYGRRGKLPDVRFYKTREQAFTFLREERGAGREK